MKMDKTLIFGFPVFTTKISKSLYERKKIISTIEQNFKINNQRNKWDKQSVMHHSYNDWSNPTYKKVNFSTLLPVYKKVIQEIVDQMSFSKPIQYTFQIVNYTCLGSSNYMASHDHPGCDFSAVHYLQFDKVNHSPTLFENSSPHVNYMLTLRPDLLATLAPNHNVNSWAYRDWKLDSDEDDFCLVPGVMRHCIESQQSKKKNRITVVINVDIKKQDA